MSRASSDQTPGRQRLAGQRMAERARKHLGEERQHGGAPGHRRSRASGAGASRAVRRPTTVSRPAARSIAGHAARVNGTSTPAADLQRWRRRRNRAPRPPARARRPSGVDRRQPDQVGVVELLLVRRRQRSRVDIAAACWSAARRRSRSATGTALPSTSSPTSAIALAAPPQAEPAAAVVRQRRRSARRSRRVGGKAAARARSPRTPCGRPITPSRMRAWPASTRSAAPPRRPWRAPAPSSSAPT